MLGWTGIKRDQVPIEPGPSLIVHKAQGQTLRAIVDVGSGHLAPGGVFEGDVLERLDRLAKLWQPAGNKMAGEGAERFARCASGPGGSTSPTDYIIWPTTTTGPRFTRPFASFTPFFDLCLHPPPGHSRTSSSIACLASCTSFRLQSVMFFRFGCTERLNPSGYHMPPFDRLGLSDSLVLERTNRRYSRVGTTMNMFSDHSQGDCSPPQAWRDLRLLCHTPMITKPRIDNEDPHLLPSSNAEVSDRD